MHELDVQKLSEVVERLRLLADDDGFAPPVAVIAPSTESEIEEAFRLQEAGLVRIVGGLATLDLLRPVDAIDRLKASMERTAFIVFSDQILAPADASVLVRTGALDAYFSPFEAILNAKYGYRLAVWNPHRYRTVEPCTHDLRAVFGELAAYLQSCRALGDLWKVRNLQKLRSPAERTTGAMRKLRFFRSAVINAYRHDPGDPVALSLLQGADCLQQRIASTVSVQ